MIEPDGPPEQGGDHDIGRLVQRAYGATVDIDTASRHLWQIHRVARALRARAARRTLVSALAGVMLFATTGAALALSSQSLPGDSLYTVKRGAERLHMLVSFAPESDARLHLRFARSRIAEARRVAGSRPEMVPALLSEIVASVDSAMSVGGDGVVDEIELVRMEASTALSGLDGDLDAELASSVDDALHALLGTAVAASDPAGPGVAESRPGPGTATAGPGGVPEPAGSGSTQRGDGERRTPAPDRTTPAPATGHPELDELDEHDEHPVGEEPGPGESDDAVAAGELEVEAGPPPGEHAGAPAPAPAAAGEEPSEVAAGSTMPTLERLEELLRRP